MVEWKQRLKKLKGWPNINTNSQSSSEPWRRDRKSPYKFSTVMKNSRVDVTCCNRFWLPFHLKLPWHHAHRATRIGGTVATPPQWFPLLGGERANWSKATPPATHRPNDMNGMSEHILNTSHGTQASIYDCYITQCSVDALESHVIMYTEEQARTLHNKRYQS